MDGMTTGPGFGDNSGLAAILDPMVIREQLEADFVEQLSKRDDLLDEVARFHALHAQGIPDSEVQAAASDMVKAISTLGKDCEAYRVAQKRPFDAAGDTVQAFFKADILDKLTQGKASVERAMTVYGDKLIAEQRRVREEARRVAQAEATAKAAEAQAALRKSELARKAAMAEASEAAQAHAKAEAARTQVAMDAAIVAEQAADREERRAAAPVADLSRTRGAYGGVSSMRATKKWRVTNLTLVPEHFKILNEKMIVAAMRSEQPIDGIEYYEETGIAVR